MSLPPFSSFHKGQTSKTCLPLSPPPTFSPSLSLALSSQITRRAEKSLPFLSGVGSDMVHPDRLRVTGTLIGIKMHWLPGKAWSREEAEGVFQGVFPVPFHHIPPTQAR